MRTPRWPHLALLVAACLIAAAPLHAQSLYSSWVIGRDHPTALGQAQSGRVAITSSDNSEAALFDASGSGVVPPFVVGSAARMVESTDDSLFVIVGGGPTLAKYSRTGVLQRFNFFGSPSDIPRRIVPLDDGRVLLAFNNADPSKVLRVYDRSCAQVGNIPTVLYEGHTGSVIGLTRRPDGSIVTCVSTFLGNYHLTCYSLSGVVLWDVAIPAGGAVASDSHGAVYVCHGNLATTLDVYGSDGAAAGSWSGVSGELFGNVIDITGSPDGSRLFVMIFSLTGPIHVYSDFPVPARAASWGSIKASTR